jgi:hypothetical protein
VKAIGFAPNRKLCDIGCKGALRYALSSWASISFMSIETHIWFLE